jgi:hypothetical protein
MEWLFKLQKEVYGKLDSLYKERTCMWQCITDKRVVESWTCYDEKGNPTSVMITMSKSGVKDYAFIFKTELLGTV